MIRPPEERRYTARELAQIFRIDIRTLRRWVATGKIPEPIRYSRQCLRWRESQIRAFLDKGVLAIAEEAKQ